MNTIIAILVVAIVAIATILTFLIYEIVNPPGAVIGDDGAWKFDGTKFASFKPRDYNPSSMYIEFEFKVEPNSEGIFFYQSADDDTITLHLMRGKIYAIVLINGTNQTWKRTINRYDDGKWHTVGFAKNGKNLTLQTNRETITFRIDGTDATIAEPEEMNIGGVSKDFTNASSLTGEILNFKYNGKYVVPDHSPRKRS